MSNGAPAITSAKRSEPLTHENKITYQKYSAYFFHIYVSDLCRTDRL